MRLLPTASLLCLPLAGPLGGQPAASDPEPTPCELPPSATGFAGALPRAVTSFGAAVAGGHLYVLGGSHGTPHEYDTAGQSDAFWRMSLADGSWQALQSPGPGQGLALLAWEDALVRVGGMVVENAPGEPQRLRSVDRFERYDPLADAWEGLPPLPDARSSHMAAVAGSTVWVAGGWRLAPTEEAPADGEAEGSPLRWHDDVVAFDLADPAEGWRSVPAPFRRRALGVCAGKGALFVLGGIDEQGEVSSRLDVLDLATHEWTRGPDFPASAFGVSAAFADGAVHASAGDGVVYRWRPGEERWTPVVPLAFPRFFHQLVAPGAGALLALGGVARGGRVAHVERVDLSAHDAPVTVHAWSLPSPCEERIRQGLFLRHNDLYLFGGSTSADPHVFDASAYSDAGHVLGLADLRWRAMAPAPSPWRSMKTFVRADGASGYAVGGLEPAGDETRTRTEVVRYDFRYDTWTVLEAGLDAARNQFELVADGQGVLALGGRLLDGIQSGEAVEAVARWDPAAEDRPFVAGDLRLPRPRRAFGAAVLGGRCYLVGGMDEGFDPIPSVDVLDLEQGAWEDAPSPATQRLAPQLAALGERLWLAGGTSERDGSFVPDRSVEVFDPREGSWTTVIEELPFDTKGLRMLPFGDRLLLYAPDRAGGRVRIALLHPDERATRPRDVAGHFAR